MIEQEQHKVLDHGIVQIIDIMASDADIAKSARISYNKKPKKGGSTDEQLIRYLMRNSHSSPIETAVAKFYLKLPIFVMRQLMTHRTASKNEISGRYSELPNEIYVPEIEHCGPQSEDNKQGRSTIVEGTDEWYTAMVAQSIIRDANISARNSYEKLLGLKTSKEISRVVLPLGQYTETIWSCNLRNFLWFLNLRMDPHAQYEIRVYADKMYELIKPFFPLTTKAWEDYILNARSLSALDQQLLMTITNIKTDIPTEENALALGMSKREYQEFCQWLQHIRKEK